MKIETIFSPTNVDEMAMRGKNVVIIDILRASTTICLALHSGAREVIPTADIETATKIYSNLSADSRLLGGERQGKMIEGFNLGNSPREYTPEKVRGKTIVFTTTNGAGAIYKCRYASLGLIGSFVNMSAVVRTMVDLGGNWTILCSGREGTFSLEDSACAGMIIQKIREATEIETDDGGKTAVILYRSFRGGPLSVLKQSEHGKYLISIGFSDDLQICASVDSVNVIPAVDGMGIKLRQTGLAANG